MELGMTSILTIVHLCNACRQEGKLLTPWQDMNFFIQIMV